MCTIRLIMVIYCVIQSYFHYFLSTNVYVQATLGIYLSILNGTVARNLYRVISCPHHREEPAPVRMNSNDVLGLFNQNTTPSIFCFGFEFWIIMLKLVDILGQGYQAYQMSQKNPQTR